MLPPRHTESTSVTKPIPTIAVITALPKEKAAFAAQLEDVAPYYVSQEGGKRRYDVGYISSEDGGKHWVALAMLPDMGNNIAAVGTIDLLRDIPSLTSFLMVGIAGGVPNPFKSDEHVRLGDIVVSDRNGVVQYDYGKNEDGEFTERNPPRPPAQSLISAVRHLQASEIAGNKPWLKFIQPTMNRLQFPRPDIKTDLLVDTDTPTSFVTHPRDSKRKKNEPRVFFGAVASSNTLLKNARQRDKLRDKFHVKAVEMEGAGVADACWHGEKGYLVIRGICDYCDASKGDNWQNYAAVVAAAYAHALIASMPAVDEQPADTNVLKSGTANHILRPDEKANPTVLQANVHLEHVHNNNAPQTAEYQPSDRLVPAVLAILHACPTPFPVQVLARCLHCSPDELEQALKTEIDKGNIGVAEDRWSLQFHFCTVTDQDSAGIMASALEHLFGYIDQNDSTIKGRSQVDNAIELAKRCKLFQPELVASTFDKLQHFLKRRGNKQLVMEVANLAIEAARLIHPRPVDVVKAEAVALVCGLSWVHQRVEQFDKAHAYAIESLDLGQRIRWARNTAFCNKCLGRLFRRKAEFSNDPQERRNLLEQSIEFLTEAIHCFSNLDFEKKEAEIGDCYSLLARTHLVSKDIAKAEAAAKEAYERLDETAGKDFLDLQILLGELSVINREWELALRYFDYVIRRNYEDDYELSDMRARAFYKRGFCKKAQKQLSLALKDFQEAARIWEGLADTHEAARAKWQIILQDIDIPQSLINELKQKPIRVRVTAVNLHKARVEGRSNKAVAHRDQLAGSEIRRLIEDAESKDVQDYPNW